MKIKFSYVMLVLALVVAGCSAYFSIFGLSQLFSGASTAVIIMASVLELGKIVTTTALHTYWYKLGITLKIYLTISVGVLMIITSAGIYGFLSNAYQKTANKLEIHEGEVGVLIAKKDIFDKSISENKSIIETKTKRINQLSGLRTNQENRIDNTRGNYSKDKVRRDIEGSNIEIQKLSLDVDNLNNKNISLSDSVSKYNVQALELKAGSEVAGEVGPLKYISGLTGIPMDNVVNYMILLLIFVFDPLAIALILATNRIFQLEGKQTPFEPKVESLEKLNSYIIEDKDYEEIIEPQVPSSWLSINDVVNEVVTDGITEEVNEVNEVVTDGITEEVNEVITEDVEIIEESEITTFVSEKEIEVPIYKKEPVIPNGKIEVEDIKEVKENRGYSVPVPQSKGTNTIERIGSNKHIKDGDNNKFFFRRKQ
jgi:hypothetical protein